MADITLGTAPAKLKVVLVAGADFVTGLRSTVNGVETDWETGTVLTLVFSDTSATTFTAVISGSLAQWNEDEAVVDALIAANPKTAKLFYTNGAQRLLWAAGEVVKA